jgi:hypothetical protein
MNTEIWKSVKGYEGHYEVSSFGRVKSMPRFKKARNGALTHPIKERILRQAKTKDGYYCVVLCKDSNPVTFRTHRIIAQAFIKNPKGKPQVNHKDRNRLNNSVDNLEWCTDSENIVHGLKNRPCRANGNNANNVKLTKDQVLSIRALHKAGCTTYSLAKQFNVHNSNIGYIVNRKSWKHI